MATAVLAQHGIGARGFRVQVFAQRAFQRTHVDPAVGLGDAGALAEQLQ